jgi:type VI secretion system secreted protein Hcp
MSKAAFLAVAFSAALVGPALAGASYMKFDESDGEAMDSPPPSAFDYGIPDRSAKNIYMKVEGIDGEAIASPTPGAFEIQISQLDQLERMAAQKAPRGGQNIPLSISSLNFTKVQDKASPKLAQAHTKGQAIPRATLFVRKAGGENYLTVKLENCMISSYQLGAHSGSGRPTESLSINFTKILVDYKPQGSPAPKN